MGVQKTFPNLTYRIKQESDIDYSAFLTQKSGDNGQDDAGHQLQDEGIESDVHLVQDLVLGHGEVAELDDVLGHVPDDEELVALRVELTARPVVGVFGCHDVQRDEVRDGEEYRNNCNKKRFSFVT